MDAVIGMSPGCRAINAIAHGPRRDTHAATGFDRVIMPRRRFRRDAPATLWATVQQSLPL
jgi:hypothetical protein